MRILVLEPPAGDQHSGVLQGLNYRLVGLARPARFSEHAFSGEAWGLIGKSTIGIDGVRDRGVDLFTLQFSCVRCPNFKILTAVPWSSVDKPSSRVLGHVMTSEEWNVEVVTHVV